MSYPMFSLNNLSESIIQGLPVTRYRDDEGGKLQPVVNVKDLNDLYVKHELEQVKLGNIAKIERFILCENDVVIAIRGSLLKSSVITKASAGSLAGSNVAVLRPKDINQVNPSYIAVVLRSKAMEGSIADSRSSITLPSIRVADVRELSIPRPDLETQNRIVTLYRLTEEYTKLTLDELAVRQELTESVISQILNYERGKNERSKNDFI